MQGRISSFHSRSTRLSIKFFSYWPYIDDAIRHAAFDRRVHVRLLMSKWQSTRPQLFSFLHSLRVLNSQLPSIRFYNATGIRPFSETSSPSYLAKKYEYSKGSIEIKIFEVPPYKVKIPFARLLRYSSSHSFAF